MPAISPVKMTGRMIVTSLKSTRSIGFEGCLFFEFARALAKNIPLLVA